MVMMIKIMMMMPVFFYVYQAIVRSVGPAVDDLFDAPTTLWCDFCLFFFVPVPPFAAFFPESPEMYDIIVQVQAKE